MLPLQYVKVAGCVAVLVFTWYLGFSFERSRFMAYKADQAAQTQKLEKEYQAAADKIESEKNAQIRNINSQLADAISQLHKRPSRATEASTGKNCNGTGLYAEDAEFLVREAARADEMRTALQACYKQYDALK